MGKLTELMNKGVRLIVADAEGAPAAPAPDAPAAASRQMSAEDFEAPPPRRVARSEVPAAVADFASVYQEAALELPAHGYGIDKVGEMLENKRFANLPREAKATAVLVALEAAGAPIRDVIQDAVQRDRALDAFEADKARELQDTRQKNDARIKDLNGQLEELIQKINTEVQGLKQASEQATRSFEELRTRKRRDEERLHAIVSHFIDGGDNPITTSTGAPSSAPPAPKTKE